MSVVRVVEVRLTSYESGDTRSLARFVLHHDGRMEIIELARNGRATVDRFIVRPGVRTADGRLLTLDDGAAFLEHVWLNARGPLFFATEPFEMDSDDALAPR